MENQRKTFLSYSRVNKEFAIRLAKELKAEGFDIWLDQLDIPAGSRWDREVEKALKESEIFMIILTQSSIESENVLDEIGYAIDNGKRFLPVLLEKCEVPLRLRRFQYVDFTNKDFDDGVESAKGLLRNLIAQPTIPRGEITGAQVLAADAERKAKEKPAEPVRPQPAVPVAPSRKAETAPVPIQAAPKKSRGKGLFLGIVVVGLLVVGLAAAGVIGYGILSNKNMPAAQPTAKVVSTDTKQALPTAADKAVSTNTDVPSPAASATQIPTATVVESTPTVAGPAEFFTTSFSLNTNLGEWEFFENGEGDEDDLTITPSDTGLVFNLNDADLYVYYIYTPVRYEDVTVRIKAENLGQNTNNVSLVCRRSGNVWYEFSITSGGVWYFYDYNSQYNQIDSGGTTAIRTGKSTNEYEMSCIGNEITLRINGETMKTLTLNNNLHVEGQVGFNISSLNVVPIDIKVIEFEIAGP